ncbi:MAG: winged helix-turn-helix transcriptional regulator [Anaerolineae bacterium]
MLTTKNVLIVDSDASFIDMLAPHLEARQFSVHIVQDAYGAQALIKQMRVHLALVNVSLLNTHDQGDLSGVELAVNLSSYTRVVMTARQPSFQMVRQALAPRIDGPAPACEFIRKEEGIAPIMTTISKVLNLTLEAIHANGQVPINPNYKEAYSNYALHPRSSERFTLDLNTRVASIDNTEIALTDREYRILNYFMDHAETVVTREDIVDKVLHEVYDPVADGNRVNNIISRLRKKIEPDSDHPQFIVTRWGSGWMFYPQGNAPQIF